MPVGVPLTPLLFLDGGVLFLLFVCCPQFCRYIERPHFLSKGDNIMAYRKKTEEEKNINRLWKQFQKTHLKEDYDNWFTAREQFYLTPTGVEVYKEEAMEVLGNARHLPTPYKGFRDAYTFAAWQLKSAIFLEQVVAVRLNANGGSRGEAVVPPVEVEEEVSLLGDAGTDFDWLAMVGERTAV